ncbi:hypothetical protein WOSG25_080070 [Weissella oryzae SG25]|uniref:Accessory Sec system protein Asp3 n=1 Tax=Weissella oryzae (strain DSM 25784 / JCM 18191 / LMG 30913 / SG25) TaxID=1329250 RepID=A0A069CTN9_WEIOS|nr:accessory Sec system protein Asp3 [Weissella oryzae]GAK31175.1 hypothetical protein WOSG25_080070 [Weissella oryzae SG25]
MTNVYFVRWPNDLSDVSVHGSTIQLLPDGTTYFSNVFFSPGMPICTWHSKTDYMLSGGAPSLPLLEANSEYHLSAILEADQALAVQLEIKYFDVRGNLIETDNFADLEVDFVLPNEAVSYDISLLNLKHQWIKFKYLILSDSSKIDKLDINFSRHSGWVTVNDSTNQPDSNKYVVNFSFGQLTELNFNDSEINRIFAYSDGNRPDFLELMNKLGNKFLNQSGSTLSILPGKNFEYFPTDLREELYSRMTDK